MTTVIQPEDVAARAREILAVWEADPEFGRLWESCAKYSSDWTDCYGYTVIDRYDALADAPALFIETMRVMALKSAMYELSAGNYAAPSIRRTSGWRISSGHLRPCKTRMSLPSVALTYGRRTAGGAAGSPGSGAGRDLAGAAKGG
ncbi:hypothetical protein ACIBCO_39485 [Streptomyces violascens]|uniref:hypothetical protein n=1 Tax=Streptomyces violascens TaxID=67381 RepID=UPI0037ABA1A6